MYFYVRMQVFKKNYMALCQISDIKTYEIPSYRIDVCIFISKKPSLLQVMKKAIESGQLNKEKRKSKNASLLQLQKTFKKK